MDNEKILILARQRLAELWTAPFHKSAILDGSWDTGSLMQRMIERVTNEVLAHREEDNPDD